LKNANRIKTYRLSLLWPWPGVSGTAVTPTPFISLLMYNYRMPISLETQEIMVAFAIDNKDNLDSWGKYILEELQDAYADMPEIDRASTTGQRIKHRIEELENVEEDKVKDDRQNEKPEQRSHDNKQRKQIIIGGIIVGFIILLLGIYFFV